MAACFLFFITRVCKKTLTRDPGEHSFNGTDAAQATVKRPTRCFAGHLARILAYERQLARTGGAFYSADTPPVGSDVVYNIQ